MNLGTLLVLFMVILNLILTVVFFVMMKPQTWQSKISGMVTSLGAYAYHLGYYYYWLNRIYEETGLRANGLP